MRWGKNLYYYAGAIFMALAVAALASSLADPSVLTGLVLRAEPEETASDKDTDRVEREYGISFAFPDREPDEVSLYIPEYDYIELSQAEPALVFFDIDDGGSYAEVSADGPFYTFGGERGSVRVNKYYNRIIVSYNDSVKQGTNYSFDTSLNDTEIVARALNYLDEGSLTVDFEEITIAREDGSVSVVFYPKTGELLNHGHPVTVTMDEYGGIQGLDYFRLSYEKMATIGVIPMKEAYYELPPLESLGLLEGEDLVADIDKCEMVYVFWDSILQPSYYFEGEVLDRDSGETARFTYYINASKFQ